MVQEVFLVSISITLLVMSAILVTLFSGIRRSLAELIELLRDFRKDAAPVMEDVRIITRHAVVVSERLRNSMAGVGRMTDAVGNIGSDLEEGRKAVKGGIKLLGEMLGPWLAKLKE